jgi:aldehyde dehydrogenase (NAD+)
MGKTISKKKNNTIKLKFDTSWQYAPAPESKSAATINKQYDLFINGEWVNPSSGKYFDTINPATEEKLSEIADANAADVDTAVKAARRAYEKVWKENASKRKS